MRRIPTFLKKNFVMTNTQMMEKLKNVSVYKRIMPRVGINFASKKSQELLKGSIESGCANSYFPLADQFQTQADPTFCGPTTMVCVFNSLGVDPRRKWKGIWRWYLEGVIKCLDIDKTKDFGMTLEEFCLIAKCNGVFPDAYRPDTDEPETEIEILKHLKNSDSSISEDYKYENSHEVIKHDKSNSECKENFEITIKKANQNFFETCVFASTRRENFFLVTNTSRTALKQTGDGHFSPVAAFHPASLNLLLMDAARFKYNSMWFTTTQIFNAFKNLDKATNKPRGFVMLSRYYYHLPRICKFSFDLESIKSLKGVLNLINTSDLHSFTDSLIGMSDKLNDIKIKSLLLAYYNDLENRSSFRLNDEYCQEFIKYNNDNIDISKEEIFKPLKVLSSNLKKALAKEVENNQINTQLKEFLKFLFYLDNKFFVDFFALFAFTLFKQRGGDVSGLLTEISPSFEKEVKILIESLGL